ncbi:SprT-like domain-containing protein [Sphingobacterium spiritivorum]|uniref:SprT-like domain-containing protein n=1 Tax=Sphingobacterium spiritivorum TaxID=258 RepID=UPI003DA62D26
MPDYTKQLQKYMPELAAPIISQWIIDSKCSFKISRARATKLGDYQAPYRGESHKISVNNNLNPYSFLITTIHEFAHLRTWQQHKNKVRPHGTEWKDNFKFLMEPFLKLHIFPEKILHAVIKYLNNPAASSCTDLHLFRTLKEYDSAQSPVITVEMLNQDDLFSMKNGRVFQRKERIRKRYRCVEVSTNRIYLFHPVAEIYPIPDPSL